MSRKHSVRVTIMGEEFTIRSDASPDHTRAVAEYLDRKIREIMASGLVVESHKASVLAALQITNELFVEREGDEKLAGDVRGFAEELRRLLPPPKRETPIGGVRVAE
jgi:cell division protein ZapA